MPTRSTPKLRRSVAKKNLLDLRACTRDTRVCTGEQTKKMYEGEKGGGDRGGGERIEASKSGGMKGDPGAAGGRPLLKKLPLSSVRRS